jgi:G:T-mismatch repair DNA endonuclease (very short patch repair protein)
MDIEVRNDRLVKKANKLFEEYVKRYLPKLLAKTGYKHGYISRAEKQWVKSVETQLNRKIETNYKIDKYKVDGYDPETNTVYEFNGCYYHGCNICYRPEDINPSSGKSMGELYKNTIKKEERLKRLGYNVISKWGCQFKANDIEVSDIIKVNNRYRMISNGKFIFKDILSFLSPNTSLETQDMLCGEHMEIQTYPGLLEDVMSDTFFGVIECDINVHIHLRPYFEEMCPVFKNVDIQYNHLSLETKSQVNPNYKSRKCENYKLLGEMMKLIGNSSYGQCIKNMLKYENVRIIPSDKYSKNIRRNTYKSHDDLVDGYEFRLKKTQFKQNLPVQIGFAVYQLAKLRILQFYYDFLDFYIDRCDFQLIQIDTDSAYIAISLENLEDLVKPNLIERLEETTPKKTLCLINERQDYSR